MKNINNLLTTKKDELALIHSYQDACSNKEFKEHLV